MQRRKRPARYDVLGMAKEIPIGEKIRKARLARGLSAQDLAKKCGVDRVTIHLIETGKRKAPRPGTIKKIIEALAKVPPMPEL